MRKVYLRQWGVQCVLQIQIRLSLFREQVKKHLEERFVRKEFLQVLGDREALTACQGDDRYVKVTEEMNEYEDEVISPIISAGDIIGAASVLLNKDKKKHFGEVEQRVAVSAADFLGRQME